ncbi:MAG: hypothetical protein ACJATE_001239 [Bacteroidia bacterium]|jgi:hypothetical protein
MRLILVTFLAATLLQSCTEPDTTSPLIDVFELTPIASSGLVCGEIENNVVLINSNDTLEGQIRLTDDSELSQYKLDLHNNFDCHGHAGKVETTDWYVLEIEDVGGSEQIVTFNLSVPMNVTTGNYHFSIQATDESGNSAESIIFSLQVTNSSDSETPVLAVNSPSAATFSALKGDQISFEGTVTDNIPLGTGSNGKLELRYWEISNQTISTLYELDFESSTGALVYFDFDATVPITTSDGTYIFEVRSFDATNNPSNIVQFTVEID